MNINSPRVEENIRKLAKQTNLSLTDAMDSAVAAELRCPDTEEQSKTTALPLKLRLQPLLDELARTRLGWCSATEIMKEFDDENDLP